MIYILMFEQPIGSAKHSAQFYVRYCNDGMLTWRLKHHRAGTGAAITRYAARHNIAFDVIHTEPGDWAREREIKNLKNTRKYLQNLGVLDEQGKLIPKRKRAKHTHKEQQNA